MLRRLHTRIVGMGSFCGMAPSPPAEVFLKSLPPPCEVDHKKYLRFEREERERQQQVPSTCPPSLVPEAFYEIQTGAAGHKHVVLVTTEGNLITFGDNRYGQTAAPQQEGSPQELKTERPPLVNRDGNNKKRGDSSRPDSAPLYIDLSGAFASGSRAVSCGSNYTIVYQPGGRRAIGFGNNHVGQLGVGHKNKVSVEKGFAEWDPTAAWWGQSSNVIRNIACGFNHAVLQLSNGSLLSFGSNTWGELGIGSTVSPMEPTRIRYFEEKGIEIVKAVAGNSFTLFLAKDGRVYGCGATNFGQLPPNEFEPVPVPVARCFQHGGTGCTNNKISGVSKLIRIKDIACVGSLAVFVSCGNEIFLQGALPEYGFQMPAPRLFLVDQGPAIEQLRRSQLGVRASERQRGGGGFDVGWLVQGPTTLLVVYQNGCVAGLGANAEGQLQSRRRRSRLGREVNLAPAFAVEALLPVLAAQTAPGPVAAPWHVCGAGFTLAFDRGEFYAGVGEDATPVELPPARAR